MSNAIAAVEPIQPLVFAVPKTQKVPRRLLTLEEFYRRYGDRKDGFKYEFQFGFVEKTPRTMTFEQLFIAQNLTRKFAQTQAYADRCELVQEVDQMTSADQMRRPDLSLATAERIRKKDNRVSEFVIEIISGTDRNEDTSRKMEEYFAAGVRVVWHILPKTRRVEVYTSPLEVKICKGEMICSAAPVLLDFEISVDDIFRN